jgi:dihydroorotate dehydrogenase electron transfer subunit
MIQGKFKIVSNQQIAKGYYKLAFRSPEIAKKALAGQFLNIKVSNDLEPLLRRPFGIHRISNQKPETSNQIEILYEVVGKGTEILSRKKSGEYLGVIGPLGNGFSLLSTRYSLLVGGGMGVAPLVFLAERLAEIQNPKSKIQTLVLIGAKTENQILCEKEFQDLGCDVKIATDDGSRGFKGYVSDLLKNTLPATNSQLRTKIYACGPKPMLKEIAVTSKKFKIPAQVSLEEHMACGIGACFGCAVMTKGGYKRVCKDGPVFEAGDIIF